VRAKLVGGGFLLGLVIAGGGAARAEDGKRGAGARKRDRSAEQSRAAARRVPLRGKDRQNFWSWLSDPHKAEVDQVLAHAMENRRQATSDGGAFDDSGAYQPGRAERRRRLLADAQGMLWYARRLAPARTDVLRELAIVADESDEPGAEKALERYLAQEVPERISADARVRLGRWYARQRRFADATVQLRLALGSPATDLRARSQATILMATVLMHSGRLAEAIDLLGSAVASIPMPPYGFVDHATQFALAVAYDRDEQITLAHETLATMRAGNPEAFSAVLTEFEGRGHPIAFVPPWERHYYAGLQFELLGHLAEARAEWLAYLRVDDAPYRGRVRQHLELVDRLIAERAAAARRAPKKVPAPPPPLPPGVIP
jgi:tetratricopeptide (TPR) repeat protein